MNPAIVWRFCLAGMIVTWVVAFLQAGTICSLRVYKAEFLIQGMRSSPLEAVVTAVEPRLVREGFRLEGRMDSKAWWLRSSPGPMEWVSASVEDEPARVLLVLYSHRRASRTFRHEREALARDLKTAFGEDQVAMSN